MAFHYDFFSRLSVELGQLPERFHDRNQVANRSEPQILQAAQIHPRHRSQCEVPRCIVFYYKRHAGSARDIVQTVLAGRHKVSPDLKAYFSD